MLFLTSTHFAQSQRQPLFFLVSGRCLVRWKMLKFEFCWAANLCERRGRVKSSITELVEGVVEMLVISSDWASGDPLILLLASACKDNDLRRETGYAEEDDVSVGMVDVVKLVVASSSESAVVAGSVSICRTLLDDEALSWPIGENITSVSVTSTMLLDRADSFRLSRSWQEDEAQDCVFQNLEVVSAA